MVLILSGKNMSHAYSTVSWPIMLKLYKIIRNVYFLPIFTFVAMNPQYCNKMSINYFKNPVS
jgi:hypothetical protein